MEHRAWERVPIDAQSVEAPLSRAAVFLVLQAGESEADTVLFPSTAGNASKLAEKVLDSTINIPPLIYQNQGGIVGIYVARDVDFSSVYELKPTASEPPREGAR